MTLKAQDAVHTQAVGDVVDDGKGFGMKHFFDFGSSLRTKRMFQIIEFVVNDLTLCRTSSIEGG